MTLSITKRIEFDAGHRLVGHESKCAHLHGHRYAVEVTVLLTGSLDKVGRVVDFSVIKEKLGGWIDDNLDHAFIANAKDPIVPFLIQHKQRHMVVPFEPTAENLAGMLLKEASRLLKGTGLHVSSLVLWETPTSRAEVRA